VSQKKTRRLHALECVGLAVAWGTFWGGLCFHLGISPAMRGLLSALILTGNIAYHAAGVYLYAKQVLLERSGMEEEGGTPVPTQIVPVGSADDVLSRYDDEDDQNNDDASYHAHVINLMNSFNSHEAGLQRTHSQRQSQSKRKTESRLLARQKVRQNRALRKVPLFAALSDAGITALLEATEYERFAAGTILCRQGDAADKFYILISGSAVVSVSKPAPPGRNAGGALLYFRVGLLNELDVFGETCLAGGGSGTGEQHQTPQEPVRNATVTATAAVQVLSLKRDDWARLLADGVLTSAVADSVQHVREQRASTTAAVVETTATRDASGISL
jgi:CRP-like cAMP-binding protein